VSVGEEALIKAIHYYFELIDSDTAIDWAPTGLFNIILTKRQRNDIKNICTRHDWLDPELSYITITTEYLSHILNQRKTKDNVTHQDCAKILSAAFSSKSRVAVNKKRHADDNERDQQAVVFNASSPIAISNVATTYGTAIIEISFREYEPVTAYHTRLEKIKALNEGL
jgi:hypothetical protein